MQEVLGRVLSALRFLKPKINNTGAGSVQVGKAGGAVRIVNVTQHIYAAPSPASQQAPMAPRVTQPQREVQPLTETHKEVLALMQPLTKATRIGVLDFMRREFDTAMVKELRPQEVYRLKLYVQQVRESVARRKTHELL